MKDLCALDIVYSLNPLDHYDWDNKLVADVRIKLGKKLSQNIPAHIKERIDYITPCPNSGNYYAMGLAKEINKYYLQAIVKKNTEQRLFSVENINERKFMLKNNLIPIAELIKGRKVAVVDEAIFSGMTLKILVEHMKFQGASEVYLCIPSPPCYTTCPFGKHKGRTALLQKITYEMLSTYFNCDGIFFQKITDFKKILGVSNIKSFCIKCFEEDIK